MLFFFVKCKTVQREILVSVLYGPNGRCKRKHPRNVDANALLHQFQHERVLAQRQLGPEHGQ